MQSIPEIIEHHLKTGQMLFEKGFVREPLFAAGTYQVEVQDNQTSYFPFLQIQDEGGLLDSFCTCKVSEKGNGCPHLSAAYLRIFNGTNTPLHVRFRQSLWNQLFQLSSKKAGYETTCLKQEEDLFVCRSKTKKQLFSIHLKTEAAQQKFQELVTQRIEATEETSLKFSNLSTEEIANWKGGESKPGALL